MTKKAKIIDIRNKEIRKITNLFNPLRVFESVGPFCGIGAERLDRLHEKQLAQIAFQI